MRDNCGDYYQKGQHCWAMNRPLADYGFAGSWHYFTSCIGTGSAATPTPANTLGSLFEDKWATSGYSWGCWVNLVNNAYQSTYCNSYKATVSTDLGCTTSDLGTAEYITDAVWAHATCDWGPYSYDTKGDCVGCTYPNFPHTYNAPWIPWGHGKSGCNCREWSNQFRTYVSNH